MLRAKSNGNCYVCGQTLSKAGMKTHIAKANAEGGTEKCTLLKIEGNNKGYWLFVDIPQTATLSVLDGFMRAIWLECCGHMSEFYHKPHNEIDMDEKIGDFDEGMSICHDYDMGSTTTCIITSCGETSRKKQKEPVRLLARNEPFSAECAGCGEKASCLCTECAWDDDNPHYCEKCGVKHEHDDMFMPIVNSPRSGVCGYGDDEDLSAFDPKKLG